MPFTKIDDAGPRRLVVAEWGEPKSGKTHLACTFPEPIRVLNFDFGLAEIKPKFPGKDIQESRLPLVNVLELADCAALLKGFYADYLDAIKECDAAGGTVVIDTASHLWEIVRTVKLQEVKARRGKGKGDDAEVKVFPFDYAESNQLMGGLLRRVLHAEHVNAVFIHHAKEAYNEGGKPTGKFEIQGFGQTTSIAQVTLHMLAPGKGRIDYCRFDPSKAGMEVGDLDYDMLAALCGITK